MFNFFKKAPKEINLYAPMDGELLPLSASPDEAFAQGLMGEGLCINPSGSIVYAPFDCEIDIFHTLHAIGCKKDDIEIIVHVGMNTTELKGEGFTALVALQGSVSNQTPLLSLDRDFLLSKTSTLITPIIVVSKPDNGHLEIIKDSGFIKAGELIMKIIFK